MKAVILAAGKGTRMRELTNELPKPMLRVSGKPILEHIVAGVVAAGVREIFIVTGWRAGRDRKSFRRRQKIRRDTFPLAGSSFRMAQARRRKSRKTLSEIRRFC